MRSIKSYLAVLVLAVTLPGLMLGGLTAWWLAQDLIAQREQEARRLAQAAAEAVGNYLDRMSALLRLLARLPLDDADPNLFYRITKGVDSEFGFHITLLDFQGQQLESTRRPGEEPLPRRIALESVRQAIATGRPVVSDLFFGRLAQDWTIAIDAPVAGADRRILSLSVDGAEIARELFQLQLPAQWLSALLDGNGKFIARSLDGDKWVGKPAEPALIEAIRGTSDGIGLTRGISMEGVPLVKAFHRVPGTRWEILIGIPETVLVEPIRVPLHLLAAAAAGGIMLTAFAAFGLARPLGIAARALADSARAMGRGRPLTDRPLIAEFDEVQQALAAANDLIRDKEVALRAALAEARKALAAKAIFLATVSHELRTPLNAIVGFSDLLRQQETKPERKEYLKIIADASTGLMRLIQDVLDLSRIDAGQTRVEPIAFNLRDLLVHLDAVFRSDATARQLQFAIVIREEVPFHLFGDPGLLRQLLINLISNALKFTERGGVTVEVARGDDDALPVGATPGPLLLEFRVMDTGRGIRPENQQRIFEMFEQEDELITRRAGGAGLGLAICKRLAELMGGKILVKSEPGAGSCFTFAASFQTVEPNQIDAGNTGPAEVPELPAGCRILVVEDDAANRRLVTDMLLARGAAVTAVESGADALAMLERRTFQLILTDLQLPVLSGLEVAQRIRSASIPGVDPLIPIIAVSAHALPGDRERFLGQGLTDYISKPIVQDRLIAVLRTWLVKGADAEGLDSAELPGTGGVACGSQASGGTGEA